AVVGIERGDSAAPPSHGDQGAIAHDQRRARRPEARHPGIQLLENVHLPALLAALGVETAQHARDAEGVDTPLDDAGRPLRSRVEDAGEGRSLVGGAPQLLAGPGVKGPDFLLFLAGDARVDEDAARDNDGDAVALPGGNAPEHLWRVLPRLDL